MTEPLTEHLRRRLTGPPGAELVVGALFSDNGDTGQDPTPLDGVTFRLFRLDETAPIAELTMQSRTGSVPLTERFRPWSPPRSTFVGFRFPAEVIVVAERWYLRYGLSYRDVEKLLAERANEVDHVTVNRWVQRFAPLPADAARFTRHVPGDRWFVETYVKVDGVWRYVNRAVDHYGQVIDVLLWQRRDAAAGRRFFARALRMPKVTPSEVVTDATPVSPRSRSAAGRGVASRREVRE